MQKAKKGKLTLNTFFPISQYAAAVLIALSYPRLQENTWLLPEIYGCRAWLMLWVAVLLGISILLDRAYLKAYYRDLWEIEHKVKNGNMNRSTLLALSVPLMLILDAVAIVHLYFSDGSDVKVIYEHGFFDLELGEYVYIDASNYADFIGHRFVAEGDIGTNSWREVTLDRVVLEKEVTTAWSPVTFSHLCYYTDGVLSMPGGIEGLFNIFEVDTEIMAYDAEKKAKDIETYGLFTFADFGDLITEAAYEAFYGAYLKVAIGKGLLTWEDIEALAERYVPMM